ncbi:hypothetical protein CsSME_00053885 [Camellia sinensis var. sinensis]
MRNPRLHKEQALHQKVQGRSFMLMPTQTRVLASLRFDVKSVWFIISLRGRSIGIMFSRLSPWSTTIIRMHRQIA